MILSMTTARRPLPVDEVVIRRAYPDDAAALLRLATLAPPSPPQGLRVWSALGAIYVIWGSTYLAIRVMVETVPPALGAGARFVIASILVLGWLAERRGPAALRITPRQ